MRAGICKSRVRSANFGIETKLTLFDRAFVSILDVNVEKGTALADSLSKEGYQYVHGPMALSSPIESN